MNRKCTRSRKLLIVAFTAIVAFIMGAHARADSITVDPNFNAPFFASPMTGVQAVLLPDGKYVVFFNVDTNAAVNTGGLVRYNADGTLDTTFSFTRDYVGASAVAATSGGKLIVATSKTVYGVGEPNQHRTVDILRLNSDGSIDSTFAPAQSTDGDIVRAITIDPQGKILVAGLFTAFNGAPWHGIVRLLADGTVDPDFSRLAPIAMTCPQFPFLGSSCGVAANPVVQSDGKILIGGDFTQVNGVNRQGLARLNSDGTLDQTFVPFGYTLNGFFAGSPRPIRGIGIQSDGSVIIGGRFNGGTCGNRVPLVRLNGITGNRDNTYAYNDCLPNGLAQLRNLIVQADDKVVAVDFSVWRFNPDGTLDSTFHNPSLTFLNQQTCDPFGDCGGEAFDVALADAGTKLFVGGNFAGVDNMPGERWCAAKFNVADGTLDPGFTTSGRTGGKVEPNSFLRGSDGSTFVGFPIAAATLHLPAIPHGLGRLTLTGALDTTYDPVAAFNGPLGSNFIATGFTVLPDSSILVTGTGGSVANYNHLLSDLTQDPQFQPDPNVHFTTALPRDDGKLVLSLFDLGLVDPNLGTNLNAQAVMDGTVVQRLNASGLPDSSFQIDPTILADMQKRDASSGTFVSSADPTVGIYIGSQILAITADRSVLFGYVSSGAATCDQQGSCQSVYRLVRLKEDGSRDSTFNEHVFPIQLSFIRTSVKECASCNPSLVPHLFYPIELPVKQAKNVLDNKVVLMGSFASYGGAPANGMLRINSDGSIDNSFSIGAGAQWTQTPVTSFRHPAIDNLEVGLDDKLLVTGTFEAFNGTSAPGIIGLNPDGTVDPSFVAPVKRQKFDYQPAYLGRQKDGSFLLSGPYSRATNDVSPSFLRLLLPPGTPTPAGSNVIADEGGVGAASDITVRFTSVASAGSTSVSQIDPNWAGQLPPGYEISGSSLAFEIYTTSGYAGPITVCFALSSLDAASFAAARVLHNDGTGLVDVTSSKDATTMTICASVSSLSPFVIAHPPYSATIQPPINADGSSVFTVKRGVAPIKFSLAVGGASTCALPPATISVTRTAGANTGSVNEATYIVPADTGSNFRIAGCQYVYNLNSGSLGAGTYRVEIKIDGRVVGSGTFTLN